MKESDLAKYFINYLNYYNYDLYFEVQTNMGITDIVGVQDKIYSGFEIKNSFGLAVIEQAINNKWLYHYNYVCIPFIKISDLSQLGIKICEQNGIGILGFRRDIAEKVSLEKYLENYLPYEGFAEILKPKINRKVFLPELHDYHKRSIAGSQNDRMTGFKEMVEMIKKYLDRRGVCKYSELFEHQYYYKNLSNFKANFYTYVRNGVIKGIEINRGNVSLIKNEES